MKKIHKGNIAINIFSSLEKIIPSIGMAGLTILVALETTLRYLFGTMILGMEEVAVLLALYCYLLGAASASRDNDHIRVNVLDEFPLPMKIRWAIKVISGLISVGVTGAFAYISIRYGMSVAKSNLTIIPLGISKLFAVLPLIIGFCLMFIHEIKWFIRPFLNQGNKLRINTNTLSTCDSLEEKGEVNG